MSNLWEWNVITDTNIGNYHFPILCLEGILGMSDKMRECYKAVFFWEIQVYMAKYDICFIHGGVLCY